MENDNNFFDGADNNDVTTFDKRYTRHYSDDNFWNKIKKHYKNVGKKLVELVIVLFYTLRDSDTPRWAKTIILGALGYFILPVDIIPDFIPISGFTDDFASITLALGAVALHIKEEHKEKARAILDKYFSR
jgi:uncharacterized membrane protein YkvA (DUF1232 family)